MKKEFLAFKKIQTKGYGNFDEYNLVGKVDLSKRFKFLNEDAILKFGVYGSKKKEIFQLHNIQQVVIIHPNVTGQIMVEIQINCLIQLI